MDGSRMRADSRLPSTMVFGRLNTGRPGQQSQTVEKPSLHRLWEYGFDLWAWRSEAEAYSRDKAEILLLKQGDVVVKTKMLWRTAKRFVSPLMQIIVIIC